MYYPSNLVQGRLKRIKKHISKERMKIKENLKTCALKKVYIKKEHDKSKTRALKIKIGF